MKKIFQEQVIVVYTDDALLEISRLEDPFGCEINIQMKIHPDHINEPIILAGIYPVHTIELAFKLHGIERFKLFEDWHIAKQTVEDIGKNKNMEYLVKVGSKNSRLKAIEMGFSRIIYSFISD